MTGWIEQYLAWQAEEERRRAIHRLASAIYPTAWGDDAGVITAYGSPHRTAAHWAERGLKELEKQGQR